MKFTESHEWISVENGVGTVGVTQYAQKELGDIVYVELPKVGAKIEKGKEAAVLESTKAAADVYSPATGKVVEINTNLQTTVELINTSPEKDGWLFKIALEDPKQLDSLMDNEQYLATFS